MIVLLGMIIDIIILENDLFKYITLLSWEWHGLILFFFPLTISLLTNDPTIERYFSILALAGDFIYYSFIKINGQSL